MNIEQKVMMLRELRKLHSYMVEELERSLPTDEEHYRDQVTLIAEKIEQILKTV
jgi:hypothetical protein